MPSSCPRFRRHTLSAPWGLLYWKGSLPSDNDSNQTYLREYYDVEYYEDLFDWTHSYEDMRDGLISLPRERENEKIMRTFYVDKGKKYPIKNSKGEFIGKYGLVSYREKGTPHLSEEEYFALVHKREQEEEEKYDEEDDED